MRHVRLRLLKRVLCPLIALCLCVFSVFPLAVFAADSIERQSDAVRTLNAMFQRLYPIGNGFYSENTPSGTLSGSAGFAKLIYYRLFGESVGTSNKLSECPGLSLLESFSSGETARANDLKTTLGALRFGDFLQFDGDGTVSFLLGSQGGDLVAYDCGYSGGNSIDLHFLSYQELLERLETHALHFYRPQSAPAFTAVTLSVVSKPQSQTCFLNTDPSLTGLTLNYASEQAGTVSVTAESSGLSRFCNTRTSGIKPVILFYGVAFTFTRVEVSTEALTDLKVKRPPTKTEYYIDEEINMSGAEIVAKLKDGSERVLTEADYSLEYDFSKLGVATVKVSYGGQNTTFAVSVSNPPAISMSILPPSKTVYYAGEDLDLTGGALLLNFETRSNVSVPLQKDMLAPYDTSHPGKVTITVRYESLSADFTVEVLENAVTKLKLVNDFTVDPDTGKTKEYRIGSHLSPDTIELELTYANGLTRVIKASSCVITINGEETTEFKRAGEANIVFIYDGVSSGISAVLVRKNAVDELVDILVLVGSLVLGIPLSAVLIVIIIRRAKAKKEWEASAQEEPGPDDPETAAPQTLAASDSMTLAMDTTITLPKIPSNGKAPIEKDLSQHTIRIPPLDSHPDLPAHTADGEHPSDDTPDEDKQ